MHSLTSPYVPNVSERSSCWTNFERCPTQRVVLHKVRKPSLTGGKPFFFLSSCFSKSLLSSSCLFFRSSLSLLLLLLFPRRSRLRLLLRLLLLLPLFPLLPLLERLLLSRLLLRLSLPFPARLDPRSSIIITSSSVSPACSPSSRGLCLGTPSPIMPGGACPKPMAGGG